MDALVEIQAAGLSLRGFSRAGLATAIRVQPLGLLLDAGLGAQAFLGVRQVLISHLHPDHWVALPQLLSMRKLLGHPALPVLVPADRLEAVACFLEAGQATARTRWRYELVPAEPGVPVPVGPDRTATPFAVPHLDPPSLGYVVHERRHRLRPELVGLDAAALAARRRRGEPVDEAVSAPVLAYSGDTTIEGLRQAPEDLHRAQVLLVECSFAAPEHRDQARETEHVHLEDLAPLLPDLQNGAVVLYHVSLRYRPEEFRAHLRRVLDDSTLARVQVLL
jgi:ribonuclease Z